MLGEGMANEIEDGMRQAGLPPGLLAATGSDPWATFNPRVMMGGNAKMLRMIADDQAKGIDDGNADANTRLEDEADFIRRAKLIGTENIDGIPAFHLRADGMNQLQQVDGQMYEPFRRVMRMAGVMDAKQQKEMAEAKQKMAEFETQLAQMPPAQLEMMRAMSSGGGFEIVTVVNEMRIGETPERQVTRSMK